MKVALLLAISLAATCVALAPGAAASPPTCTNDTDPAAHGVSDYAECIGECLESGEPYQVWPFRQLFYLRCP